MALPTAKELKKLATACRKNGIKSLKCEGFEFTLSDEAPSRVVKSAPKGTGEVKNVIDDDFDAEGLTQDQLLMWSAGASY